MTTVEAIDVTIGNGSSAAVITESPSLTPVEKVDAAFSQLFNAINTQRMALDALRDEVKKARSAAMKSLKEVARNGGGRKKQKPEKEKRMPSGIHKPGPISDELCIFLGLEPGTLMARTTVTPLITNYIRDNKLQDPTNKRNIIPDKHLALLLGIDKDSALQLDYFNIQRMLSKHYLKTE
jgi:chromatin remodeling complex protein RSC6